MKSNHNPKFPSPKGALCQIVTIGPLDMDKNHCILGIFHLAIISPWSDELMTPPPNKRQPTLTQIFFMIYIASQNFRNNTQSISQLTKMIKQRNTNNAFNRIPLLILSNVKIYIFF